MVYNVSKSDLSIKGNIKLDGSKSISNRALIIKALCEKAFDISYLSTSKDTTTLQALLNSEEEVLDAGAAGTTFRFMTAYLSLQEGTQILTGSDRMKQRPIGVLVDALRKLGANIEYLENDGYPPLKIYSPDVSTHNRIAISANVSSQYISALLMIGPVLPNGIELELATNIVSRPYIEMTLKLMAHFGIQYQWEGNLISVPNQKYQSKAYKVEADWSAASYYYSLAAFSNDLALQLNGLWEGSVQGDAILAEMMMQFGVQSTFNEKGVLLTKTRSASPGSFEWDFIRCPDIAQTIAVVCAGLGVPGSFTGLETLRIKETDRIAALQNELAKVKVDFSFQDNKSAQSGKDFFGVSGHAKVQSPVFETYEDHRMAMAFAPLAMLGAAEIKEPMVVVKSYPKFWEDLETLGFVVISL
ncbi:MAG: 3-phosphoshikimate 1-carboxyvinyltransferase [Saprospiraceae bacterium]|jgi:3-phosphoshikimate 1-carboxyvinyltransferase